MYRNLQKIMEQNKVTYTQIAEIIGCDYRAVSDTIKGIKKSGFSFEDAKKIKNVLFPEYDFYFMFERTLESEDEIA